MTNFEEAMKGRAKFEYYREGIMHFKCSSGLRVQIPVDEIGEEQVDNEIEGYKIQRYIAIALNIN